MTPRIGVYYATKNGTTLNLAQRIVEILQENELEVELISIADVDWKAFAAFDVYLWGSPTYGSGDLHPHWDKPERHLRDVELEGKVGASFGCGSSRYTTAFWAVDILENRLKNCGASLLAKGLKMDTLVGLRVRDADAWARSVADAIKERFSE